MQTVTSEKVHMSKGRSSENVTEHLVLIFKLLNILVL